MDIENLEIQTEFASDSEAKEAEINCDSEFICENELCEAGLGSEMFTIRTQKPIWTDEFVKCYITADAGGWSRAVRGAPEDDPCDVLANCVGYAQGRFCEIYDELKHTTGNAYRYLNCNAKNFIKRAQETYPELEIGDEPKPGAILVWDNPNASGHVAIVERVNTDGSIFTSESSYNGKAFYNKTRYYNNGHWEMGNGYTQLGFIYNPAVEYEIPEIEVVDPADKDIERDQLYTLKEVTVYKAPNLETKPIGELDKNVYYNYKIKLFKAENTYWFQLADNQ